jgi:GNAT superfamily N-acetyltransferase
MDPLYFEALSQLETAGGRKTIKGPKGEDSNNLYNIKDLSGKGFRALDKAEGSNDAYRVYASREDATSDLVGLLSRKYPKALEATDRKDFAQALKDGGYATDPQYVEKFTSVYDSLASHGGVPSSSQPAAPAPAARSLDALYAAAQGPRPPKQFAMTHTAAAMEKLGRIEPIVVSRDSEDKWYTRASDQQRAAVDATDEANGQSLVDIARSQFMDTFGGTIAQRMSRPEYKPDGFVPTEQDLVGFDVEEQDTLRHSTSHAEFERVKFEIQDHKDRLAEAGKSGAGWAVLGGLIAGLPEGYASGALTSFAFAKTAFGSIKLASQARKGAAFASSLAENVGANVAMTAGQDYLSPHIGLQDYVMAGLGGSLSMALHAPRIIGASRSVETKLLHDILDAELQSKTRDVELARKTLGEDADPQAVARKANEFQSERVKAEVETHRAALGDDRKLLSNDTVDELVGDAKEPTGETKTIPSRMEIGKQYGATLKTGDAITFERVATQGPDDVVAGPGWVYNADEVNQAIIARDSSGKEIGRVDFIPGARALQSHVDPAWRRRGIGTGLYDAAEAHGADLSVPPSGTVSADAMALRAFRKQRGATPELGAQDRALNIAAEARLAGKQGFDDAARVKWDEPGYLDVRARMAKEDSRWRDGIRRITGGLDYERVSELPAGVHVSESAAAHPELARHIGVLRELAAKYLSPESRLYIHDATDNLTAHGEVVSIGNVHMIGLNGAHAANGIDLMHTAMHEMGHAIFHEKAQHIPADLMAKIREDYGQFFEKLMKGDVKGALHQRVGLSSPDVMGLIEPGSSPKVTPYLASFDEYLAEQYTKHLAKLSLDGDTRLSSALRTRLVNAIRTIYEFFHDIGEALRGKGFVRADKGAHEFFSKVLDGTLAQAKKADEFLAPDLKLPEFGSAHTPITARTDADIQATHGLDTLATDTPSQRARVKALTELYRKAEAYPMPDPVRMSKLLQAKPLQAVAPTALKLLQSDNPVARMVASELLESGSGAAGRRTTAAIAKWVNERAYMGNSLNDFQRHYVTWRNANGGGMREDFFGGEKWAEFNRRVAVEMENRKNGRVADTPQAIHDAADVLEAAYDRMRVAQIGAKTPGWAALPESSIGYMPHRMAAGKVRALSPEQGRILHGVLAEQFQALEGFDAKFSHGLASKYMDIMRKRATAGYSGVMNVQSNEAADIVQEAAAAMGMTRDEAQALAKRVLKAAPAHTRSRLQLDLTRSYTADGKSFQLLDLFETDQVTLLRSQVGRVSGETALIRHGIPGSTGLKVLRDALAFGQHGEKADNATLEAFDQVAAEFLGTPFGTQNGKWMDRALQFNSLASLGGMGFNQLAETLNGATTLGARHALAAVGSFGRLRGEILALSRGERVHNPIIGSLETYGAEFGTDHYKMVFPFDMPERATEMYGVETLSAADRLLRSGVHLQGKLSLWRAITATQERGMAEQIVHKALRYIRDGQNDVHLADMGIDAELSQKLRASLGSAAQFDARGRLTQFDITKIEDQVAADAFVQAVHRGTRQIIQGTFIGETGKWAHSGFLKLLMQFKTFSLVAIDKQWNRQVGNVGTAKAMGMLLGTMSFAAPIYMVRVGLASIGRPDRDEYLRKALHPYEIARQTLNYVALSGLAGDLLDATTALAGYQPSGGRSGANKSFVGNVVAPSVGKVDDIWGALQNTKDGTDVARLRVSSRSRACRGCTPR